jgi:aspartate aminotransferase
MSVARTIQVQLEQASWIRRMFEIGTRMKAERGADNVFDFTLGNPDVEPPKAVLEALKRIAAGSRPQSHAYMNNAGYASVREIIAKRQSAATGLPYTADHILMTNGSAGAMNAVLKAMLDPGDEVIVLFPYFPEYRFYIENHAGKMVRVETDQNFYPDARRIEAALTERTKAIILNSPNNPTGVLYPAETIGEIAATLERTGHPAIVLSDEPYKRLVFDGLRAPEIDAIVPRTVTAYSWSKAMAIPGERIGYLAISPRVQEWNELRNACTFTNRILGFINAPAIWQWVVAETADETVDVATYQTKRDLLCDALARIGYRVVKPQGSFYVFPASPIPDDLAFVQELLTEGILAVPGTGFGRSGYFRLSLTIPKEMIERSIPGFERAFQRCPALR